MVRRFPLPTVLLLAFLLLPAAAPAADDVGALVKRTIRAYGGEKALAAASACRQEGTVTSIMRGGREGRIVREFERPDRLRVRIDYGTESELRIYDGREGWRQGQAVTGPQLDAMVLQAARMALPWNLRERRKSLVDKGTVDRDGKELRVLQLPLGKGMTLDVEIDPSSGRILQSAGRGQEGLHALEFITSYSDFREVAGILVPFREGNYANGVVTGETKLSDVDVAKSLPPGTFRP